MTLPVLQPITCDGCGKCCHGFHIPPFDCMNLAGGDGAYEDRENDPDFADLPDNLKRELESLHETWDERPYSPHCPWFDPQTNRCVNYEHRPVICREFHVGGDVCLDIRGD